MAECQCQPQFGCRPAGRCCHRPRPPACPNFQGAQGAAAAAAGWVLSQLAMGSWIATGACKCMRRPMARPDTGPACWGPNTPGPYASPSAAFAAASALARASRTPRPEAEAAPGPCMISNKTPAPATAGQQHDRAKTPPYARDRRVRLFRILCL